MLRLSHTCMGDGKIDPTMLMRDGPWVVVEVRVPPNICQRLVAERKPIPAPVRGKALIDTGATMTFLDMSTSAKLGLDPVSQARMGAPGRAEHFDSNLFVVDVAFFDKGSIVHVAGSVAVAECSLSPQPWMMLLGRDFLSQFVFTYDGPGASFSVVPSERSSPTPGA